MYKTAATSLEQQLEFFEARAGLCCIFAEFDLRHEHCI